MQLVVVEFEKHCFNSTPSSGWSLWKELRQQKNRTTAAIVFGGDSPVRQPRLRPMPRARRNLPWHQSYGAWNNRLRPQIRVSFRFGVKLSTCWSSGFVYQEFCCDIDGVKSDVGFFFDGWEPIFYPIAKLMGKEDGKEVATLT